MERFDPRVNGNGQRPAASSRGVVAPQAAAASGAPLASGNRTAKKRSKLRKSGMIALILVLLASAAYYLYVSSIGNQVSGTYQAVFLTNNEAYFGKITAINNSFVKMTNVYYIQNKPSSGTANANSVELVQLVKAVHGPKDEIILNRDQVLFFENLKDDGQAAKLMSGDKIDK